MDRYSEMEMTKIARAEFKRGKAQAKEEMLKEIDEYCFSADKEDNILIKRELKEKIK